MKLTVKVMAAALVSLAFIYTACKKVSDAPVPNASPKDVAGLIAKDFSNALAGNYGGVSMKDGIKPPAVLASAKPKVLNSFNSLCGFTVDTTVKYVFKQGDSIKSVVIGKFKFTYTCSSTVPDGYKVFTDFTNAGRAPGYAFVYDIAQAYTVQALDASYSKVSMDGKLKSFGFFKYGSAPFVDTTHLANSYYQRQNYVMHNLVIDINNNLDIISGSATFTTKGRNQFGKWEYEGTIEYVGNHTAIITFDGHSYSVNLLTGVVTPI